MRRIENDDWKAVAELMLSSAEKLAGIGAGFLVAPCNTIHLAIELATPRSPLPSRLFFARDLFSRACRIDTEPPENLCRYSVWIGEKRDEKVE
jgi:hypothetical protein